jgi:hypothetical protein
MGLCRAAIHVPSCLEFCKGGKAAEDLLPAAALHTFLKGGSAYAVAPDVVPSNRSVAALYDTHQTVVSAGKRLCYEALKIPTIMASTPRMAIWALYSVLFEELTWTVRSLVVDTGTWLPGRQVLIAPISLGVVDWETQRILRRCVPESARWRELSLAEAKGDPHDTRSRV